MYDIWLYLGDFCDVVYDIWLYLGDSCDVVWVWHMIVPWWLLWCVLLSVFCAKALLILNMFVVCRNSTLYNFGWHTQSFANYSTSQISDEDTLSEESINLFVLLSVFLSLLKFSSVANLKYVCYVTDSSFDNLVDYSTIYNFGWHTHRQGRIIRRSKYKHIARRHTLGRVNKFVCFVVCFFVLKLC